MGGIIIMRKIIGILIMTILITTALPVISYTDKNIKNKLSQSSQTLSAWCDPFTETPDIDGQISSGEWSMADSVTFNWAGGDQQTDITLYVMNDYTYLYLSARIDNDDRESYEFVHWHFLR